jgi:hypothetical protein
MTNAARGKAKQADDERTLHASNLQLSLDSTYSAGIHRTLPH